MKYRKLITLFLIILLLGLTFSCSTGNSLSVNDSATLPVDNTTQATVIVTRDFGSRLVMEGKVEIGEHTTVLDALKQIANVETEYSSGFISAIEGISASNEGGNGPRKDWFYYINGISSKTGAGDYILHNGDVEYWDFRDWSFRQFIPAIVGDFPEPFMHGYDGISYPTIIVYQDGWAESAGQIADRLSQLGVLDVSVSNIDELAVTEKESANLVLLGTGDHELIAEINQVWDRLGLYICFQNGYLEVYNSVGDLSIESSAGTGIIQATQSPWNPKGTGACENVVWVVSGIDVDGVAAAVDALVNRYSDFKYAYSVLVNDGEIIKVPR